MWIVFKLTSHLIQNPKPSLGYFTTDNSNVLKNTTLTIRLLYTITKHLKRELHFTDDPLLFSVLLEMGLQMEHFRGPTQTLSEFVTLALTVELRERKCVVVLDQFFGCSFLAFGPSLKILKLIFYLHSSNFCIS
jgi:hypothetical protein